MKRGGSISIWFFIGISLLVNGLLILGAGIHELVYPPQTPVVLFHLHSSVWWGAILAGIGAFYCTYYAPGKGRS
jgi:hypothetical protein